MEKFLSDMELSRIQLNEKEMEISKFKIERLRAFQEINNLRISNNEKEVEIANLRNKLLNVDLDELRKSAENLREENRNFMLSLKSKYELADKWGFNPESGEIIEN